MMSQKKVQVKYEPHLFVHVVFFILLAGNLILNTLALHNFGYHAGAISIFAAFLLYISHIGLGYISIHKTLERGVDIGRTGTLAQAQSIVELGFFKSLRHGIDETYAWKLPKVQFRKKLFDKNAEVLTAEWYIKRIFERTLKQGLNTFKLSSLFKIQLDNNGEQVLVLNQHKLDELRQQIPVVEFWVLFPGANEEDRFIILPERIETILAKEPK